MPVPRHAQSREAATASCQPNIVRAIFGSITRLVGLTFRVISGALDMPLINLGMATEIKGGQQCV
jgi:hypothetical protein